MSAIKYVGAGESTPVYLPVGSKPKRSLKVKILKRGETLSCSEDEAKKLIGLDSSNFEIVSGGDSKPKPKAKTAKK